MSLFRRRLLIAAAMDKKPQPPQGKYIQFKDKEVERICIENFSSDGIGVSYEDAEKVSNLKGVFNHTGIVEFNELEFFTGLTELKPYGGNGVFEGCSKLKIVTIPKNVVFLGDWLFLRTNVYKIRVLPETPPIIGRDRVMPGGAGAYYYIPDASLDTYKTNSQWNYYMNRFRPLSEYQP